MSVSLASKLSFAGISRYRLISLARTEDFPLEDVQTYPRYLDYLLFRSSSEGEREKKGKRKEGKGGSKKKLLFNTALCTYRYETEQYTTTVAKTNSIFAVTKTD